MKNEATKKATIPVLNMMIEHADKGPSGFWTGDNFITSCQFGKKCETCKRRQITFYEISKNGKSVKIKITTMHGFFTMVENDIDKLLTLIFEHGDI